LLQGAPDLARFIRDIDQYVGQIARAEVYLDGDEPKQAQAIDLLNDLTKRYPQRIEAYLKLWSIYYNLGNYHLKKAA
jgi:predicted Zn-dependent protease